MTVSRRAFPVLMYHKVGAPVAAARDRFLNVSATHFRRQMRALSRLGYQARPFADIVRALRGEICLPPRTVAITFDDGYQCIGDAAAPILAEFGFPATIFAVSQGAGRSNAWDRATGQPELPLLGWPELRALDAAGWEIGGHTRSHPHLDQLEDGAALREIALGKAEIEAEIGRTCQTFCYPFGHLSARTPGLVRAAGFLGACTTRSGLASARYDFCLLPRVKVASQDGVSGLLYRMLARPHLPDLRRGRRSHDVAPGAGASAGSE